MIALDELQQDMLTEIFNLGMGNAAAALSEMVQEEVLLSVPQVSFMKKNELVKVLESNSSDHISSVSQQFQGQIIGQALLTFPTDKSLELVRLLLQENVPLENLTEFEEEALIEVGNIIINAGLSSLADIFEDEIISDLPEFNNGSCSEVIEETNLSLSTEHTVLHLQVNFTIENKDIEGYVIYLFDIDSLEKLAISIQKYISNIT